MQPLQTGNGEEQLNNKLQKNSEKQRHCKFALSEQNHEFRKNIVHDDVNDEADCKTSRMQGISSITIAR